MIQYKTFFSVFSRCLKVKILITEYFIINFKTKISFNQAVYILSRLMVN